MSQIASVFLSLEYVKGNTDRLCIDVSSEFDVLVSIIKSNLVASEELVQYAEELLDESNRMDSFLVGRSRIRPIPTIVSCLLDLSVSDSLS